MIAITYNNLTLTIDGITQPSNIYIARALGVDKMIEIYDVVEEKQIFEREVSELTLNGTTHTTPTAFVTAFNVLNTQVGQVTPTPTPTGDGFQRMTTAERDAIANPLIGQPIFNTTTNRYEVFRRRLFLEGYTALEHTVTIPKEYLSKLSFIITDDRPSLASTRFSTVQTVTLAELLAGNVRKEYEFQTSPTRVWYFVQLRTTEVGDNYQIILEGGHQSDSVTNNYIAVQDFTVADWEAL